MAGGTLILSRAEKLYPYYESKLKTLGFRNFTITAQKSDSLHFIIDEMKPDQVIVDAGFYHCATPFMMKELLKIFPGLNISAASMQEYPAEIAMYFILNGLKSYAYWWDGMEEFTKGMTCIKNNRKYVSPLVEEHIAMRDGDPPKAGNITEMRLAVLKLLCSGFKDEEMADTLDISRSTVDQHRKEIYRALCVRNAVGALCAALYLELVSLEETFFYHQYYMVSPRPEKKRKGKNEKRKKINNEE